MTLDIAMIFFNKTARYLKDRQCRGKYFFNFYAENSQVASFQYQNEFKHGEFD